jgi:hypothetical protein
MPQRFAGLVKPKKPPRAPWRVFGPIKTPIKPGIKRADFDDRPWCIVAGPKISACVYHCATLPVDPENARRIDAANDWDRIRKEIAWTKPRPPAPKELQSDWRPCAPNVPTADDLSIPDFLKRASVAVSESPEGLLVDALPADRRHNGVAL